MLAELRDDNKELVANMRETDGLCDEHGRVPTYERPGATGRLLNSVSTAARIVLMLASAFLQRSRVFAFRDAAI